MPEIVKPSKYTTQAIEAALGAAKIAVRERSLGKLDTRTKSAAPGDVVTNADFDSQQFLHEHLPMAYTEGRRVMYESIDLVGEENYDPRKHMRMHARHRWIVDPVDGTKPYSDGSHHWSVSIALQSKGSEWTEVVSGNEWKSTHAVIYCSSEQDKFDPATGEAELHGKIYWAEQGKGAYVIDVNTGQQQRLQKPQSIANVVEYEEPETAETAAGRAYSTAIKSALAERGLEQVWHRSICFETMEVLEGKKAAVACGAPGPYEWDIGALSLIASEAGAHTEFAPAQKTGEQWRYPAVIAWDTSLFDALKAHIPAPVKAAAVPTP